MALLIVCDVCGRGVKSLPWKQRNSVEEKIVCPGCRKKEAALENYISKIRGRADLELRRIYADAREELRVMISNLVKQEEKEEEKKEEKKKE